MVKRVDSGPQVDHDALLRYASARVPGFPASPSSFSLSQFGHGQSNPTYLMEVGVVGGVVKKYVLRKKPAGKLLESAHAVEREFQVLQALGAHTKVPVPRVYSLCSDTSVIGTAFYIMEYLEGRIFVDPRLPGISPNSRREIYMATARALASLHSVNPDAIGLSKYGRKNNYCKRQVERWAKQYIASTGEGMANRNPKMFQLIDWLRTNMPPEDSSGATAGIVHGDYRIDNVIFHPSEDRVIGILDWELSTLGNQMCDIASSSMSYFIDPEADARNLNTAQHLVNHGQQLSGSFYMAFGLFRGAAIFAGIHSRWMQGNASAGEGARDAGDKANALIDSAWSVIDRKNVLPDRPPPAHRNHGGEGKSPLHQGRFVPNNRVLELRKKLLDFMEDHVYPLESEFYKLAQTDSRWTIHPEEERLKELAKKEGLWNLWIPFDSAERARELIYGRGSHVAASNSSDLLLGAGLSNLEYGYLCEIMGRSIWAPQIFNCGAPDTGNMEVLLRYGNEEQLHEWLVPLLEGKIRSGFAMTEPKVASSDATNIECSIKREGDSYIINGTKWWTSGAMDPRCKLLILMGKTDFSAPIHKQQSMILVDIHSLGIHVKRPLTVFGFDDAPHGHAEISFENVRVPAKNILLGEGRGFEIAQGRLGPGRLHHCMRLIGAAERSMQLMVQRALQRRVFGKRIADQGSFLSDMAKCRVELESTRLLVLEAADQLDRLGNKMARGTIAMAKVAAPNMALRVIDTAMQVHGAAGLSSDTVLAHLYATSRTLRIADGPDEVHLGTIAKLELRKARL
ncbi:hypothetical protein MLD38_017980 [Melastoma candidum]|uniref:Uncharacterized protein n=1 Tax=Melastoma candidum TaxID=119954 RepID=A0ACB9QSB8_9MYRT|nr:hypothetical protein MLD38_017980 [Melastoma candidum]